MLQMNDQFKYFENNMNKNERIIDQEIKDLEEITKN